MRCGTSRALFFHRRDLPADRAEWAPVLLAAMGSLDGDKRQINGVGGGSSTTSKVAVVEKSSRKGVDVDYTFVQIPVGQGSPDFSGNCGNVVSGVAPFAVDEGLFHVPRGGRRPLVKVFNTNTGRVVAERVEVDGDGFFQPEGDCRIGGFSGSGSRIDVQFLEPAGSMTGRLFPTGRKQQWLEVIASSLTIGVDTLPPLLRARVSLVDAANPFVFVDRRSLPAFSFGGTIASLVEDIRRAAAVAMGLASTTAEAALKQGTPKIALLSPPKPDSGSTIDVLAYSMGKPHPSLQLTGAVCLGAALAVPGTVAAELAAITPPPSEALEQAFVLEHPTGTLDVSVKTRIGTDREVEVEYGSVTRTARRIFEGRVLVNLPTHAEEARKIGV